MRNHEEKATSQVESLPYIAAQIADAPEQDPGSNPTGAQRFSLEPDKRETRLRGDHAETTNRSATMIQPNVIAL